MDELTRIIGRVNAVIDLVCSIITLALLLVVVNWVIGVLPLLSLEIK